jgi:hypothetical protein
MKNVTPLHSVPVSILVKNQPNNKLVRIPAASRFAMVDSSLDTLIYLHRKAMSYFEEGMMKRLE